jgi:hypothetical protein
VVLEPVRAQVEFIQGRGNFVEELLSHNLVIGFEGLIIKAFFKKKQSGFGTGCL